MSAKISALKHAKKKLELFVCENIPQIVQFFPPRHHTFEWIARSPSFPTLGRSLPDQSKCQSKHLTFFATAREISPPPEKELFLMGCHSLACATIPQVSCANCVGVFVCVLPSSQQRGIDCRKVFFSTPLPGKSVFLLLTWPENMLPSQGR